jgi:glycerol-3-phosphate dehydrogenase
MRRDLDRLAGERFDVLVVGGGIHGAAAAREAAARGLCTALIEREDFGHATSANSLRIIHGGLRYLQHGDLAKIRDSVRARRGILRRFPHLAAPLPCVLPTRGLGTRGRPAMALALGLYDLLSADRNAGVAPSCRIPRGRVIGLAELQQRAPNLAAPRASGGALWHDGIALDAERLVLELALDADAAGAAVANYVRAEGLLRGGRRIEGVSARDAAGGRELLIRAAVTIDATGPWLGEMWRREEVRSGPPALAKAVNVIVGRPIFGETAVGVEASGGGRLFFFVPWRGATMIGTAYLPHHGSPDDCSVSARDLEELVREINRIHPAARIVPEEVRLAHAGLLPLDPRAGGAASVEARLLRRPRVLDAARETGLEGLVGIEGIKYTTGMTVGARAVDLAAAKLGRACRTAARDTPDTPGPPVAPRGLDTALAARLRCTYGAAADALIRDLRGGGELAHRIAEDQPTTAAEVLHAARAEMASTLADVVLRRTPLGTCGHPGAAALARCAGILGVELDWDAARQEREIARVEEHYRRFAGRAAP